ETARLIEGAGGRAVVAPTDVTRYAEVEALMERAVRELGGLDVVVNNAGIAGVTPFAEATPEDWRAILDVNLTGVFNGCRAAAPHLIARGAGKVVNLASVLGAVGLPGYTLYAATKGGVMALTRTLGVEWARHNVQVNAIAPGWFVTDMNERAFGDPRINDRLARVWTFQYKVVGTEDWREWRLYPNFTDCEQARRFMKNLEDGQRRRLVETHHCSERENPALHQSPGPPSRRR